MATNIRVDILHDKNIARLTVDNAFVGDYSAADAIMHDGAIINPANFLARIADAVARGVPRAIRDARGTMRVQIAFASEILGEKFADEIEVACKLARTDVEDARDELMRECARLRERCARIERAICMRGADVPQAGRAFYLALLHRARAGHPVVFPMIGPDFVMIGLRIYRWEFADPALMRNSIVCCYIPQTGNSALIGECDSREPRAPRIKFTTDPARVWETNAIAVVGARAMDVSPRFVALRADRAIAPRGYVTLGGFDTADFFGIALGEDFDVYCRACDAASAGARTIEREFKGAIAATRELQRDADASGMVPF